MKQKISISIDEENVKLLEELAKEGRFRNKSHAIEYSLNKMLREEKNGK
ncbi:MAG: ribbon-helix-helix domain-containing protein [Candidatus Paceibacterota bacterium]